MRYRRSNIIYLATVAISGAHASLIRSPHSSFPKTGKQHGVFLEWHFGLASPRANSAGDWEAVWLCQLLAEGVEAALHRFDIANPCRVADADCRASGTFTLSGRPRNVD